MSAKMSITEHNRQYLENGDVDEVRQAILTRYHESASRYLQKKCISYPYVRANCVNDDPKVITDTNVYSPMVVARWRIDKRGYIAIRLC